MSYAALDALYAELPDLECKGLCAESCGPILMEPAEERRLIEVTGSRPGFDENLTCSLLEAERCRAYAARPAICRLWGMVESMPCLWGCRPSRLLTDEEGFRFLERVREVGA